MRQKAIEPTAENVRLMQDAIRECDCMVQGTNEKVSAAAEAIKLMLQQPDSEYLRAKMLGLCKAIQGHTSDAENYVSSQAENWGANYVSPELRAELAKMLAAGGTSHG